jgi:hypothetical protein
MFIRTAILLLLLFQQPQGPRARFGVFSVAGTVTDEEGRALAGMTVQAFRATFSDNGAQGLTRGGPVSVTTDASGAFRIVGLQPDIYVVGVDPGANSGLTFTTTYFPSTWDWRSATPVRIERAGVIGVDIKVPLKQLVRFSGPIYNTAEPGTRVTMFYVSRADDPSSPTWTVVNKSPTPAVTYEIDGLPPGAYDIFPRYGRNGGSTAHVRLTVPRSLQGVTMEITPGVDVLGMLHLRRFDDRTPVDLAKVQVGLVSRKGAGLSPRPVTVGPDGGFVIPRVPEMEYQLVVSGLPANAYVEAAQLDDADALHSWVTVKRMSQRLQIIVDTAGAQITGRLRTMRRELYPYGASLVLVPAQRKGNLPGPGFIIVEADRYGTFTANAVPPGDYRLLAWSVPNGKPYLNEEFMKGYLGMGDLIHVYRGARIEADAIVVDTRQ